jgi:hypothetical protein
VEKGELHFKTSDPIVPDLRSMNEKEEECDGNNNTEGGNIVC